VTDHLTVETSDRGFDSLPPIPSEYGGNICVGESSAASAPHIWLWAECPVNLNDPSGPTMEAAMHLTCENAVRLAEQLTFLVKNHYQGDVTQDAT
jgi:hypothetical protein